MPVTATNLTTSFSTANASSYNTASITPGANRLVLAIVTAGASSGNNVAPTLSGNGLTWVSLGNHAQGTTRRTSYFRAMGASPSAGVVTIDFGGTGQTNCTWSIIELDGVDTSGTNGSGAIVQDDFATDGSTADTSGTVTLTNALSDTSNMVVALFGKAGTGVIAEDADFTPIAEADSTESGCVSTMSAFNQTTATCTWASTVWGAGIIEVKAAAGGGGGGVAVDAIPKKLMRPLTAISSLARMN